MSSAVRIALVAEGITDYEVLDAAVAAILGDRPFDLKLLQPEGSVAFTGGGNAGLFGGGWKGVYQWCLQAAQRGGGRLSGDPLFISYDLLLLHLDADVASEDPANHKKHPVPELAGVLPCERPCPPPDATTNPLRQILLSWVGETQTPPKTILCTPSKSTEAWVMALFFPNDREMRKQGWECHMKPETRLGQQPRPQRFAKNYAEYQNRKTELQAGWPIIVERLTEARRFHDDLTTAIQNIPD
jgi:hypothetical protein